MAYRERQPESNDEQRLMADMTRLFQTRTSSVSDFYNRIVMPAIVRMTDYLARHPEGMSDFGLSMLSDALRGYRNVIRLTGNNYYSESRAASSQLYGASERNRLAYASYRETDQSIRHDLYSVSARLYRAINNLEAAQGAQGRDRQALIDHALLAIADALETSGRLGPRLTEMESFLQRQADRSAMRALGLKTVSIAATTLCPMLAGIHMTIIRGAASGMASNALESILERKRAPSASELGQAAALGAGGTLNKPAELAKTYIEISHAAHQESGEVSIGFPDYIVRGRFLRETRAMVYDRMERTVPTRR